MSRRRPRRAAQRRVDVRVREPLPVAAGVGDLRLEPWHRRWVRRQRVEGLVVGEDHDHVRARIRRAGGAPSPGRGRPRRARRPRAARHRSAAGEPAPVGLRPSGASRRSRPGTGGPSRARRSRRRSSSSPARARSSIRSSTSNPFARNSRIHSPYVQLELGRAEAVLLERVAEHAEVVAAQLVAGRVIALAPGEPDQRARHVEDEAAARAQQPCGLRHRAMRIGERHHAVIAEDQVEAPVAERDALAVGLARRAGARRSPPCAAARAASCA